jgi:hypothetical protein
MTMHEPMFFRRNSSRGGQKAGAARSRAMWDAYRATGVKTPALRKSAQASADAFMRILNRKVNNNEWDATMAQQALDMIAAGATREELDAMCDMHDGAMVWETAIDALRNMEIAKK